MYKNDPNLFYTVLAFNELGALVGTNHSSVLYLTAEEMKALPVDQMEEYIPVQPWDIESGEVKAGGCYVSTTFGLKVYARFEASQELWYVEVNPPIGRGKYTGLRVGM